MHLSRLAEEIVFWSTPQSAHRLSDGFSTGFLIIAAEAQPGRGGAGARQDRPRLRQPGCPADGGRALPLPTRRTCRRIRSRVRRDDTLMLCLAALTGMVES